MERGLSISGNGHYWCQYRDPWSRLGNEALDVENVIEVHTLSKLPFQSAYFSSFSYLRFQLFIRVSREDNNSFVDEFGNMKSRFRSAPKPADEKVTSVADLGSYDDYMTIPLPTDSEVSTLQNTASRFKKVSKNDTQTSSSSTLNPLGKKRLNDLMEDRRLEAMETPLPDTSKGFQLLSKFGYHGTGGLGKQGQGIADPLRVDRVADQRSGLGVSTTNSLYVGNNREGGKSNSAVPTSSKFKRNKMEAEFSQLTTSFRSQQAERTAKKLTAGDVRRAERVVRDLDERSEIPRHRLWPAEEALSAYPATQSNNDEVGQVELEDDDSSSFPQDRDDVSVTNDEFGSATDNRQLLGQVEAEIVRDDEADDDDDRDRYDDKEQYSFEEQSLDSDDEFPVHTDALAQSAAVSASESPESEEVRLLDLLSYLRDMHRYCLYCGCQYSTQEELVNSCPGNLRNEH